MLQRDYGGHLLVEPRVPAGVDRSTGILPITDLMMMMMLSNKINRLIAEERSRSLARLDRAGLKKLWAAVRNNNVSNNRDSVHPLLADPNAVNN